MIGAFLKSLIAVFFWFVIGGVACAATLLYYLIDYLKHRNVFEENEEEKI